MPLTAVKEFKNLNDLGPSILGSVKAGDSFIVLLTIILVLAYYFFFRKRIISFSFWKRMKTYFIILISSSLFIIIDFTQFYFEHKTISNRYKTFVFDQCYGSKYFGLVACWLWQIHNVGSKQPISEESIQSIGLWLREHRQYKTTFSVSTSQKNVVLIIVESLESWPVGCKFEGIEITPCLNRLMVEENTVYASQIIPQTRDGRSSDAQFIINTGLLPLHSESVFFKYPQNEYYSIAKALKAKSGYSSYTMIGDEPSFWNQSLMNPSMGFDGLISNMDFDLSDIVGVGLSDSSFFIQSINKICAIPQPFFVQMITLSSHTPFKLPKNKKIINRTDCKQEILSDYLNSINYVDRSIGVFVDELKKRGIFKNTILVIVGDHEALRLEIREKLLRNNCAKGIIPREFFVPFIIINSDVSYRYDSPAGQIDIYPTLIDLLGLNNYKWKGVGVSLFSNKKNHFVVNSNNKIFGGESTASKNEFLHYSKAWEISDLIIRSNFFKNNNSTLSD